MPKAMQTNYFLLVSCMSTRAIHLELTDSLNLPDFVLSFRRFAARRGIPAVIWSDNAKTFKAGPKELMKIYGAESPQWKYIVARAPWWGGAWERLVRSVKSGLRKTIGRSSLPRGELETSLIEVEEMVNSRPLTHLSEDSTVAGPLTPNHFIRGQGGQKRQGDSLSSVPRSGKELRELHGTLQIALDQYWSVWTQQYITNLPPVVKNHKLGDQLQENDLVMIRDEPYKARLLWPLARVVKIHQGKDGVGRCATLQTATGELNRPVQRLYKLEVQPAEVSYSEDVEQEEVEPPEVPLRRKSRERQSPEKISYTSRSGRKTDVPAKYC